MAYVRFKHPVTVDQVWDFVERLPFGWYQNIEWRPFVLIDPNGYYCGPRVANGDRVLVCPGGEVFGRPVVTGNARATGNASGNTESDGNPVTSDRKPVT